MTVTLDLPARLEKQAQQKAREQGITVEAYLLHVLEAALPKPTARELLRMPEADRNRILEMAAASAAPLYEADLARPAEERELTAITATDGDDLFDYGAGADAQEQRHA